MDAAFLASLETRSGQVFLCRSDTAFLKSLLLQNEIYELPVLKEPHVGLHGTGISHVLKRKAARK